MVTGTEQEYGILLAGVDPQEAPHPMHLSNAVIRGYRDPGLDRSVDFAFGGETPLSDARGFHVPMDAATPDMLTHLDPMANRVLSNGARFYVDHAHPEFSGPEVASVHDAVLYDRAGDVIMHAGAVAAGERFGAPLALYKNNTDGKGASYGSHENHLVSRAIGFDRLVEVLTPFLVTRTVYAGAGRVGMGVRSQMEGFQLSARAEFFERRVGLETTIRRPLINTRDEPHADPRRLRRLHVILGDANMSQYACWLKIGTLSCVLHALEAGAALPSFDLRDPVAGFHAVSHDRSITATLPRLDGPAVSAVDIQQAYAEACGNALDAHPNPELQQVQNAWVEVLDTLRREPMELADRVDWVAKLRLLEAYRERDGLAWSSPRMAAIDLQYHDIDPAKGLALTLERAGRLRRIVTDEEIQHALTHAPQGTRAERRAALLAEHGDDVVSMGWDEGWIRHDGRLHRLDLGDPGAG